MGPYRCNSALKDVDFVIGLPGKRREDKDTESGISDRKDAKSLRGKADSL